MQSKQIKTDGTVYAYAENYNWNPYRGSQRTAQPVIAKEVGVSRQVWSSTYGGRSSRKDGVLIVFLDEDTLEPTERTQVVQPQRIREEWAVFAPARDEAAQRAADQKRKALAAFNAAHDRLDAVIPEDYKRPYGIERSVHGDGSYNTQVRMSLTETAALLEAVYAAGQRSVTEMM